jgi:hypothetical protein
LIYLANAAAGKAQSSLARRFLEEALSLVGSRAENQLQFSKQLQVAHAYSAIDMNRSFEIIEAGVDRLNDLLDAAATVDGFGADCFREGELKPYEGNMWGELLRQCSEELSTLAPRDSDRAFSIAHRLRRPEAQTFATLRVAQGVLAEREAGNANHAGK